MESNRVKRKLSDKDRVAMKFEIDADKRIRLEVGDSRSFFMPLDCWNEIFGHCSVWDVHNFRLVCKTFYELCKLISVVPRIYLLGGSTSLSQSQTDAFGYDRRLKRWFAEPRLNLPLPCSDFACTVCSDQLVIAGGASSSELLRSASCVRFAFGEWQSLPAIPVMLCYGFSCVIGKVLYAGGESAMLSLDMSLPVGQRVWKRLRATRLYNGGVEMRGQIYGLHEDGTLRSYDPQLNTWTARAKAPVKRQCGCTFSDGLNIYIAGGRSGVFPKHDIHATLLRYNLRENAWETMAPMHQARQNFTVVKYDQRFWAIGGYSEQGFLNTVESYCPRTNEWRIEASMPQALAFSRAIVI